MTRASGVGASLPWRRSLRRPLLAGAALCLSLVSLAYFALWLYYSGAQADVHSVRLGLGEHALSSRRVELGFDVYFSPSLHAVQVGEVRPGSPAERAGIRRGDLIAAVDGRPLADSAAPLGEIYLRGRPGDAVRLTVVRPNGEPPLFVTTAVFRARPEEAAPLARATRVANEVGRLFPLALIVVALPVLFLRLDDRNAWLLAALFVSATAVPDLAIPLARLGARGVFAAVYQALCRPALPFLFYAFFAVFPVRSPLDRRLPWLRWLLGAGALAFAFQGLAHLPQDGPDSAGAVPGRMATAALAYRYFGIGLGLLAVTSSVLGTTDREVRRKSRVLFWGTVLGITPTTVLGALQDFDYWHVPVGLNSLAALAVFLFPLSFAYAVVKHRVLELPVLLRRSARYLLVRRGFVVVLVLLGASASLLFALTFTRLFRVETGFATSIGVGFGIALASVAAPGVRGVTELIDRSFFRGSYDVRVVLQELAERLPAVASREELAVLLAPQLRKALQPSFVALYVEAEEGTLRRESGGLALAPPALAAASPGLVLLARGGRPREFVSNADEPLVPELASLGPECLVPVLARDRRLVALVVLGPRLSDEPYSGEDTRLLASVAAQAGVALDNLSLARRVAERLEAERRVAHEIELARQVQSQLLPRRGPRLATLQYAARCVQARVVGGDYYDFLDMGPGRVGLALGDVSGKGFAAALLMAGLQASLRSLAAQGGPLARRLEAANRLLFELTEANRFATLFVGEYDDASARLRYVNCGHNPPLLVRGDGRIERLSPTAMVVGLVEEWACEEAEVALGENDLLVVYSDGITEAVDRKEQEFGDDRLIAAVRAGAALGPEPLLDAVFAEVARFSDGEQADDQTILVARVI